MKYYNTGKRQLPSRVPPAKEWLLPSGGTALGDIAFVPGMQLKHPRGIRSVAEWYMSTIMRSDYIKEVFDRQSALAVENLSKLHIVVGNNIDVAFLCGTDFGTQDSTFCSPEQFDDLWLPYYRRINNWIHNNTSWKTFKHSCGAVENFMDRFIDAGFDIINPVQVSAKGMDPKHLKETYGKDLTFWGGGINTQKTLPYGTTQMVREEVLRHCYIFAKKWRFCLQCGPQHPGQCSGQEYCSYDGSR